MLVRMQPETGGRFSLSLEGQNETRVRYALTLATARHEWHAHASVATADGGVETSGWTGGGGAPPAWLLQYARAALRSAWHQHRELGWPKRLTRWRDQPARGPGGGPESAES